MLVECYCLCGAVLKQNIPRRRVLQALSVWYAQHDGEGHGGCTATEAEAARMGTDKGIGRESRKAESNAH